MAPTTRRSRSLRRARVALRLIPYARRRAAALHNAGLREASARVSEVVARALLALEPERLPRRARRALRRALRDVRALEHPGARSWRLGTALDAVLSSLGGLVAPRLRLAPVPARQRAAGQSQ